MNLPLFDGRTIDERLDQPRLATAMDRVAHLMRDGKFRTLSSIARQCNCSEAGASARLRDLRKPKFQAIYGGCEVHSRRVEESGLWVYGVEWH